MEDRSDIRDSDDRERYGMIRIYIAETAALADKKVFSRYMDMLDETRQEKVRRCRNDEDKKRSLLAGYLLQAGAKEWMMGESGLQADATPLSLSYAYGEEGKPRFLEYEKLHFSLSHSGDYVICAFSDQEVGADIQIHRKTGEGIAKRFFSKEDRLLLDRAGSGQLPEDRASLFFQIWTVKEAYMKLTGEGMKQGMDTTFIEWEEENAERGIIRQKAPNAADKKDSAYFTLYGKIKGYSIAVCSYGKPDKEIMKELSIGTGM